MFKHCCDHLQHKIRLQYGSHSLSLAQCTTVVPAVIRMIVSSAMYPIHQKQDPHVPAARLFWLQAAVLQAPHGVNIQPPA
jgi:hypothetical protein